MSALPSYGAWLRDEPVLVTGATGKVGRRLVAMLLAQGARISILTRNPARAASLWPTAAIDFRRGELTEMESLSRLLDGIATVFHLASHSPATGEPDIYEAPSHWPVTAMGTRHLVQAVGTSKVRRLLYASSVKAMGDAAGAFGRPADECIDPRPDTLYGRAKLDAERSVLKLALDGRVHVGVLRLPMVYGLRGQGNVERILDALVRRRFPPWPRVENRRSAIHVEDAIRALILLGNDPKAKGQVYLVTDGRHYSTRWLYERICLALGRKLPGWTLPLWTLRLGAELGSQVERISGRAMPLNRDSLSKLLGDAWYSSAKIESELGFAPLHNLEQDIPRMVADYRASRQDAHFGESDPSI